MLSIKSNNRNYLILIGVYFIASLVGIFHHEIWLDESHHWLLARDSTDFADLIQNTRYEGHPILWNILLYFITRVTSDPMWMQLLHILIAASAMWVFLKNTSFTLLFKILFVFGYFMFYEYNILSRNYMIGVLFLFLACSLFRQRDKKIILLCTFLALAANTHLIFVVISFAFFLTLLLEKVFKMHSYKTSSFILGSVLFLLSVVLALFQIIPPNDSYLYGQLDDLFLADRLVTGFVSFFKALAPISDFRTVHFWNSNLFVNLSKPITGVFCLLVYFIPIVLFNKRKVPLFFIYTALFGTQLFFFATKLSSIRYFGMTFIIFVIALWLDHYNTSPQEWKSKWLRASKKYILYGILIIQCLASVVAYSMDIKYSFSSGKDITSFLEQENLLDTKIVTPFCQGTIISTDLERKVYFMCGQKELSYCNWNSNCRRVVTDEEIIDGLDTMDYIGNMIFIAKCNLIENPKEGVWYSLTPRLRARFLKKMEEQVIRDVDYSIYEIIRANEEE